jgi:5'-nucleotidase
LSSRPFFLLGNDDGVHAPGLNILADFLRKRGDVMIAAPHLERSGSSSAITLMLPILVQKVAESVFGIEGSPADAMMLALQKLVPRTPDWIVSGINRGGNLGTDTIYSGTLGAAIEGCLFGIPSIAVSVEGREPLNYETAAEVVGQLIATPGLREQVTGYILNVNVPNVKPNELKGIRTASLGKRIYHGLVDERRDPRGKPYFWLGPGAKGFEPIDGSDCVVIRDGYATVTALKPDLFEIEKTRQISALIEGELLLS